MKTSRIDVHHHLLTPEYLEELASVGVVESGGIPFPSWTPEDSLGFLDRAEIQTALLSLSSPGLCFGKAARERAVARALNESAAESVTRWPKRFGFFATLPLPDVEAALAEMSYALDTLHADGIGLLSNTPASNWGMLASNRSSRNWTGEPLWFSFIRRSLPQARSLRPGMRGHRFRRCRALCSNLSSILRVW